MKTKTTIAFSCPKTTALVISEYAARLGISRSACITMMCNAYIAADERCSCINVIGKRMEEGESNGN